MTTYFLVTTPLLIYSSDNIKELQEAMQDKTAELTSERTTVADLTGEVDNLQKQLAAFLGEKQKKLQGNLFEVKVCFQSVIYCNFFPSWNLLVPVF